MGCASSNATEPTPAIAPGVEHIDPAAVARRAGILWREGLGNAGRVRARVPAFDAPFFQAGLAGYSDAAMRIIARRHGAPFCVTEALLDRTLIAGGRGFTKADLGELHDNIPGGPEDHPLACQIMGSDPKEMAAAALKAAEQGKRGDKFYRRMAYKDLSPDELREIEEAHLRNPGGEQISCGEPEVESHVEPRVEPETIRHNGASLNRDATDTSRSLSERELSFEVIDVNLACPVKKIKSKSRGGHWLTDPVGAVKLLQAVRDTVPSDVVCTVKLRRSFDDTPEMASNFEKIFDAAYAMGYAWTTVHARTVQQKYVGPSRWTFLKALVARHPDKLIFGSGDVWEVRDIFRMIGYAGVTGVSVARGCIGNPWIFRQAREMMAGLDPTPPTIAEQRSVLEEHFRLAVAVQGEDLASRTMRKFAIRFAGHHPERDAVRRAFIAVASLKDWRTVLADWYRPHVGGFESPHPGPLNLVART